MSNALPRSGNEAAVLLLIRANEGPEFATPIPRELGTTPGDRACIFLLLQSLHRSPPTKLEEKRGSRLSLQQLPYGLAHGMAEPFHLILVECSGFERPPRVPQEIPAEL